MHIGCQTEDYTVDQTETSSQTESGIHMTCQTQDYTVDQTETNSQTESGIHDQIEDSPQTSKNANSVSKFIINQFLIFPIFVTFPIYIFYQITLSFKSF